MDPNRRGVFPVRVSQGVVFCLMGTALIIGAVGRF